MFEFAPSEGHSVNCCWGKLHAAKGRALLVYNYYSLVILACLNQTRAMGQRAEFTLFLESAPREERTHIATFIRARFGIKAVQF